MIYDTKDIEHWLVAASSQLQAAGIDTARLDCLVLLEDCLNKDRTQLLAHGDQKLSREQLKVLDSQIQRRAKHEPLAYIRDKAEFYGRSFTVSPAVLVPRPETESVIDLLKKLPCNWQRTTIIDVGTGSGAIAITASLELPKAKVAATDIDPACIKIAAVNAKRLGATVTFQQTDLIENVSIDQQTVILANLPYVPDDHKLNLAATKEPKLAIFGGQDGLDLYRRMFKQLSLLNEQPAAILTEALPSQHKILAEIANNYGFTLSKVDDFIQLYLPTPLY